MWGPIFRRNLMEEVNQYYKLLATLNKVHIHIEGLYRRIWKRSSNGVFSVASFFEAHY